VWGTLQLHVPQGSSYSRNTVTCTLTCSLWAIHTSAHACGGALLVSSSRLGQQYGYARFPCDTHARY